MSDCGVPAEKLQYTHNCSLSLYLSISLIAGGEASVSYAQHVEALHLIHTHTPSTVYTTVLSYTFDTGTFKKHTSDGLRDHMYICSACARVCVCVFDHGGTMWNVLMTLTGNCFSFSLSFGPEFLC